MYFVLFGQEYDELETSKNALTVTGESRYVCVTVVGGGVMLIYYTTCSVNNTLTFKTYTYRQQGDVSKHSIGVKK